MDDCAQARGKVALTSLTQHVCVCARAVEFATVGTPMQCIQIKMAHDAYSAAPKFRGFLDAATGIVREEGACASVCMRPGHDKVSRW